LYGGYAPGNRPPDRGIFGVERVFGPDLRSDRIGSLIAVAVGFHAGPGINPYMRVGVYYPRHNKFSGGVDHYAVFERIDIFADLFYFSVPYEYVSLFDGPVITVPPFIRIGLSAKAAPNSRTREIDVVRIIVLSIILILDFTLIPFRLRDPV
jgi:hypothetical protein